MNRGTLLPGATGRLLAATACFCVLTTVTAAQQKPIPLQSLLPAPGTAQQWTMSDSARVYAGNDLYLFIDGGADLFLEYGFTRALAAEYQSAGGATLNLEIYEMRDPVAAFGIYSIRSGEGPAIAGLGQDAISRPHYTMFRKGSFYVSVATSDSSGSSREAARAIAASVDRSIGTGGDTPQVLQLLPSGHLRKARYVCGPLGWSSSRLPEIRGLFPALDGAIGSYEEQILAIVRYASPGEARRQFLACSAAASADARFGDVRTGDLLSFSVRETGQSVCLGQKSRCIVLGISSVTTAAVRTCTAALQSLQDH